MKVEQTGTKLNITIKVFMLSILLIKVERANSTFYYDAYLLFNIVEQQLL